MPVTPVYTYTPALQAVKPIPMEWVYLSAVVIFSFVFIFAIWIYVSHRYPTETRGLSPLYQFLLITAFIYAVVLVIAGYNEKFNEKLATNSWWWIVIGAFTFGLFMLPTIKKRITYRERDQDYVEQKVLEYLKKRHHGALDFDTLADAAFHDHIQFPVRNDYGERELAYDFMISIAEGDDVNIIASKYGNCQIWESHIHIDKKTWMKRRDKLSMASREQALKTEEDLTSQKIAGDVIGGSVSG